jgi:hypothetical protein
MWPLSALGRITGYRFCGSQSAGTLAGVLDILMSEVVEYRGRRSGACTPRRLSPNASLAVQLPAGFPTPINNLSNRDAGLKRANAGVQPLASLNLTRRNILPTLAAMLTTIASCLQRFEART